MKRKASQRPLRGRKRKIRRKSSKTVATNTPVIRRRFQVVVPPSTGSGRRLYRVASRAAGLGARFLGGSTAQMAVEGASAAGEYVYDRINNVGKKGNTKVSSVSTPGTMAGRNYGPGKKVNRSQYFRKGLSKFAMAQKGITYREEFRMQDPITAANNTNLEQFNESRLIGHMSLPARATYYNVIRALLKLLFTKAGAHIDALTSVCNNNVTTSVLRLRYYPSWQSTTLSTYTYTLPANPTWVSLMDGFADGIINNFDTLSFINDTRGIRWVEIEYDPAANYSREDYNRVKLSLNYLTFDVRSKSMLKVQNQSASYASTSTDSTAPDEDSVTAQPVECHLYYVKGNQFVHQNRRKSATVGLGFLGFDERYAQNQVGAEPCPAYEYVNCVGKDKFHMDPGHIKTSIISHRKRYKFGELMSMLLQRYVWLVTAGEDEWKFTFTDNIYVKGLGHSRAIHIDKVIGQKGDSTNLSKVRIMAECELLQQIACYGPQNTATDQYEVQRPT